MSGNNTRNVGTEDSEVCQLAVRQAVEFVAGTRVCTLLLYGFEYVFHLIVPNMNAELFIIVITADIGVTD